MDKKKISKERKVSIANSKKTVINNHKDLEVSKFDPVKNLTDKKFIGSVIMECLTTNDPEGVVDAIECYLNARNMSKLLKKANVPRSTAYRFLNKKNPTIKTLAKILSA